MGVGQSNLKSPKTPHYTTQERAEKAARIKHHFGSLAKGNRRKSEITLAANFIAHHSSRPALLTKKLSAFPALFPAASSQKPGSHFSPNGSGDFVSQTACTRVHFFLIFIINPEIKKFSPSPQTPTIYLWKSRNKIDSRPALLCLKHFHFSPVIQQ